MNWIAVPLAAQVQKCKENLSVKNIILSGNKITRPQIILRELTFAVNDTLKAGKLNDEIGQSRKNLLNTSLFNFVTIDTTRIDSCSIAINIDVVERWYIWPMPFFQLTERNFNVWWETKDFSKADYGLFLTWDNFRGRKESLRLLIKMGFDETYGLAYKVPYINRNKTLGFGLTALFIGNHEVPYSTENNKQVYYKNKGKYLQQNLYGDMSLTLRNNIFVSHIFEVTYDQYIFSDTLLKLNSGFAPDSIIKYLSIYYQFRIDKRDARAYPLKGMYYDLELAKHGLGLMPGETFDHTRMHTSFRKFWELRKRLYASAGFNGKLSWGYDHPYFTEKGLGFGNDFVRGYEYYVVPGQHYAVVKSNLKYELIPTRVKKFDFVPGKKFNTLFYALYFNIFGDAAYVWNKYTAEMNDLSNKLLYGAGMGMDFVTYYDKVCRAECSFNGKGEIGFFLHFIAPI